MQVGLNHLFPEGLGSPWDHLESLTQSILRTTRSIAHKHESSPDRIAESLPRRMTIIPSDHHTKWPSHRVTITPSDHK